jgi:SNF2 family DNA or RNA helicase
MLGGRGESVIHETGWTDPWPPGCKIEQTGSSTEKADLDQQVLQEAFGLMKKGAARPLDTAKRPGIDTNTPKCLENAKKPLVLKEYQAQALNTMLDDYAAGGTGMLQGLEMDTRKTFITLGKQEMFEAQPWFLSLTHAAFLGSLKRKSNIPHLIVVPVSLLDMWECEIRNRLQPVPIFCVYRKLLDQ